MTTENTDGASAVITAPHDAGESLDKVRDILFGAQAREFERRFAALEQALLQKTAEARQEAQLRLEALEAQLKEEAQQLMQRIEAENEDRKTTITALSLEVQQLTQALEQKIAQLDAKSGAGQEQLQSDLLAQSKALTTALEDRAAALNSALNQEVKTLTHDKLNRADIAQMFHEMANRFVGE